MKPLRLLLISALAALATGAATALPPLDPQSASPPAQSTAYLFQFRVRFAHPIAAGSVLLCRARVEPDLGAYNGFSQRMVPVESAPVQESAAGSSANCAVQIPFFLTSGAFNQLSYEVDLVQGTSAVPATRVRRTLSVPRPADGAVAALSFDLDL